MTKQKLWTKDFLLIAFTNLFIFLCFYSLMVTLTVYSMDKFNTSASMAGLASSIFVIGAVFVRPFAGKRIALIGPKKLLVASLSVFFLSTLLYFAANSLILLLCLRLIHGAAFGVASTATGTIVAEIIPPSRRGEGMGYFAISTNIAMAIGPFIGLYISNAYEFTMVFKISILFSLISLIASILLTYEQPVMTEEQLAGLRSNKLKDYFEFSAIPISITAGVIGFTYSSVLSHMTSFSEEINLAAAASFFFVIYAASLLITRPFTGRWFDLRGENFVIYPSLLLYAVSLLLLGGSMNSGMLLVAGAIMGIGLGTFQSSAQTIAIKEAPAHRVGLATSTFFVMYDIGIGTGPFLQGLYIPYFGYRGLYFTMGAIAFIGIVMYYFAHGKSAGRIINRELKEFESANSQ